MINAVSLVEPHLGGTFSLFLTMRQALLPHEIDLHWLSISTRIPIADLQYCGEMLNYAPNATTFKERCKSIGQHIERNRFEVVYINFPATPELLSVASILPKHIIVIGIVHSNSLSNLFVVRKATPFLDHLIAVAPGLKTKLNKLLRIDESKITVINNAIDTSRFYTEEKKWNNKKINILFLGKIVDATKGVFLLPKLLQLLENQNFQVTVAGEGSDLEELKLRCSEFGQRVRFLGHVSFDEVPPLVADQHVLFMPSYHEGFGLSIIEAMYAGCIPIASRIIGVTDSIISHNEDGYLFEIGNIQKAANHLNKFWNLSVKEKKSMVVSANKKVNRDYSLKQMGDSHRKLLKLTSENKLHQQRVVLRNPWRLKVGGGWRKLLPQCVKVKLNSFFSNR